jgi:hypothetical protein
MVTRQAAIASAIARSRLVFEGAGMRTDAADDNEEAGPRLTRRQVADRLGCSIASVRRLEGKALHPEQSESGAWLFAAAEVEALASSQRPRAKSSPATHAAEGAIAARVFALLQDGHDLREIVIATKTAPKLVRELYAEWLVDLETGEHRRREASDARDQEREERKWKSWERELRGAGRAGR